MGGSLALSLKGRCAALIGIDPHLPTLELALSNRTVDYAASDLAASPRRVDVLILATPVPTILNLLRELPSFISYPCIVMDIGSTKREIVQVMSALPDDFEPIGAHPICGKEKLGLENASADLYQNAPFVITPLTRTTARACSAAKQIISAVGASLMEMSADQHDRELAFTSHFPFLLSSALAACTPKEFSALIGPGFRSASRLAGTPSYMMAGILKTNKDNVLSAIHEFRTKLDEIESALKTENGEELQHLLDHARSSYIAITDR